eukprot:192697_1
MSEGLSKLQSVNVEPSLKNFKNGAIGSIEMLSVGFYGIIEAFKDEMEKSRGIEEKIEKSFEDVANLKEQLTICNDKCVELNNKLTDEMKKIKKFLSDQMTEIDDKLNKMKQTLNDECHTLKQECLEAVNKVSSKVGKSLENVDRLKEQFENLEQENNDQIRSLSMRCDENKELILEQDNKFKDQLNELTEILHNKALELDAKIENCLNETTNKITQFDEKQQMFQFETNKELSHKADIEDLKHKLDISKYDEFVQKTYNDFTGKMVENMKQIETNIDAQQAQQNQASQDLMTMKSESAIFKTTVDTKLDQLQSMINNPVDITAIKQEITQQILDDQARLRDEMIQLIQQSANSGALGQAPSFGTQSGNCIACGRGPSTFQPLPFKSPSPNKKPKHGGGFNRLPSRRQSVDVSKRLKACESQERLDTESMRIVTSPKSGKASARRRKSTSYLADSTKSNRTPKVSKSIVENDPVRVQIPDINDEA